MGKIWQSIPSGKVSEMIKTGEVRPEKSKKSTDAANALDVAAGSVFSEMYSRVVAVKSVQQEIPANKAELPKKTIPLAWQKKQVVSENPKAVKDLSAVKTAETHKTAILHSQKVSPEKESNPAEKIATGNIHYSVKKTNHSSESKESYNPVKNVLQAQQVDPTTQKEKSVAVSDPVNKPGLDKEMKKESAAARSVSGVEKVITKSAGAKKETNSVPVLKQELPSFVHKAAPPKNENLRPEFVTIDKPGKSQSGEHKPVVLKYTETTQTEKNVGIPTGTTRSKNINAHNVETGRSVESAEIKNRHSEIQVDRENISQPEKDLSAQKQNGHIIQISQQQVVTNNSSKITEAKNAIPEIRVNSENISGQGKNNVTRNESENIAQNSREQAVSNSQESHEKINRTKSEIRESSVNFSQPGKNYVIRKEPEIITRDISWRSTENDLQKSEYDKHTTPEVRTNGTSISFQETQSVTSKKPDNSKVRKIQNPLNHSDKTENGKNTRVDNRQENESNLSRIKNQVQSAGFEKAAIRRNPEVKNENEPVQPKTAKIDVAEAQKNHENKTGNDQQKFDGQDQSRPIPQMNMRNGAIEFKPIDIASFREMRQTEFNTFNRIIEIINDFKMTHPVTQTRFRIDGGDLGEMEIRFTPDKQNESVVIVVDSETSKTFVQKIIPAVQSHLEEKGIHLTTLEVNVQDFSEKTSEHRRPGKPGEARQNDDKEIAQEADVQTTVPKRVRQFGYNTIELTA